VQCVESICNQTYKDLEIILVDDGSTDKSPQMCDDLAKKDNRIIVIHKQNGGSTSARNAGITISKGEYIGFVDSDDWIEPQMYEILYENLVKYTAQIAMINCYTNNGMAQYPVKSCIPKGIYEKNDPDKIIVRNMIYAENGRNVGISTTLYDKLFERNLLIKHQKKVNENVRYAEDCICVCSAMLEAERIIVTDEYMYHYRINDTSIWHSTDETCFEKFNLYYLQMKDVFLEHEDADILMAKLKKQMLFLLLRGINGVFGFSKHSLIPLYIPPYKELNDRNSKNVVLYGAGRVGQDYRQSFIVSGNAYNLCWVDKQYEKYVEQGLDVASVESLDTTEFDVVLIATQHEGLAGQITEELIDRGIPEEKILWKQPGLMTDILEAK